MCQELPSDQLHRGYKYTNNKIFYMNNILIKIPTIFNDDFAIGYEIKKRLECCIINDLIRAICECSNTNDMILTGIGCRDFG